MQWNRCSEQHGIFLVPHPTIPFTPSHLEGTRSRMSSHHAKNKINVSASFVHTWNWSLFVQQKETMWGLMTPCVLRLFMWLQKEGRKENVICIEQLINLMVVRLGLDPYRQKPTFFPFSCIGVTGHLLPLSTGSGNSILLKQIQIYLFVKKLLYEFFRCFQFMLFMNFFVLLPWIFLFLQQQVYYHVWMSFSLLGWISSVSFSLTSFEIKCN